MNFLKLHSSITTLAICLKTDIGKQVFQQFTSNTIPTNIYEQSSQYILEAELPGVQKDAVQIQFDNSLLKLNIRKHLSNSEDTIKLNERTSGELSREYEFDNIDSSNIKANLNDGILTVTLPKNTTAHSTTTIEVE